MILTYARCELPLNSRTPSSVLELLENGFVNCREWFDEVRSGSGKYPSVRLFKELTEQDPNAAKFFQFNHARTMFERGQASADDYTRPVGLTKKGKRTIVNICAIVPNEINNEGRILIDAFFDWIGPWVDFKTSQRFGTWSSQYLEKYKLPFVKNPDGTVSRLMLIEVDQKGT